MFIPLDPTWVCLENGKMEHRHGNRSHLFPWHDYALRRQHGQDLFWPISLRIPYYYISKYRYYIYILYIPFIININISKNIYDISQYNI